ncbi:LtfC-like domain-containing protein [Rhodococcoides fascians]|uniref:LtfC-like domain-containing protein n=1 Tax=Rhodococcoides fascians TaxID=1828 RepID=UPI000560E1E5|nr:MULTISPECIES: hypothetical protein [Rhodococcus]OZC50505.1 hypothetical protein CH289_15880 [Rhodococcus sp. RS1C4]OZE98067.1 hypothetical protein CH301_17125 [Rhodococcus sp. 15-1189-1-1a]OZF12717.1 hypothetical protein CH299_17810 [Rhodococcus sp. 14-2686-1-2]
MTTGLGFQPPRGLPLHLSAQQDFIHEEEHPTTQWPAGTSARIVFANGPVWSATVAGRFITWRVESTGTTAVLVPDGTEYRAYLTLPREGGLTDDWLWFLGQVRRTD